MDFNQFILSEQYKKVKGLGDRLELMKQQINWECFRPLVAKVFYDNKEIGGRPHTDEIVVVRSMLLQAWYGISDEELEFQINDRLSFRNFLDFPKSVPDFSTIWKIRERLKNAGIDNLIWNELQRQLDSKGYKISKGVIQDATFIESDLGRKRHHKEKKAKKNGEEINYTEKQKQHIDRDASFAIKAGQVHYGYKNHIKADVDNLLIRDYKVTTASLHDSQIDLVKEEDIAAYRDKGYFGKKLCSGVIDNTLQRGTRARKLSDEEKERNKELSKVRALGERPFGVIKRVFDGCRTLVKTMARVSIKEMFKCFAFDLYQLVTLRKHELAIAISK